MNIISPLILIVASVWLFLGYTNPTYTGKTDSVEPAGKSIVELQTDEQNYRNALTKSKEIERSITDLSAKFSALKPTDVEKVEKLLPDHIDTVRLILDINNAAAKYGMSLNDIVLSAPGVVSGSAISANSFANSPNPVLARTIVNSNQDIGPSGSPYGSVRLGFNVSGSYDNFLRFLGELESSLRIVDVTSLSFRTAKTTATQAPSDIYNYSMTIRTYYLK